MSANRTNYVEAREALLADISTTLKNDERFVAAWLAGSYGRGEQDVFSDLDLHVVVADAYSERLCATPWMAGAKATSERLALFSQFGTPAIIFEAHSNNQVGGTFTYVLYKESAINVDWMLIPQALAHQEHPSLLLFDKVGIPEPPHPEPASLQERIERASTHVGFFWMIAASNILNLLRRDLVKYHMLLDWLHSSIREVQAALQGEQVPYRGSSYVTFYATQEEQVAALRQLCDEMEALMPQVVQLGGYVPSSPRSVIEMRLALIPL
jgi:Streptomycin adenylyltransferase